MEIQYTLVDNKEFNRFEFRDSEGLLVPRIEYVIAPHGILYLTHTRVPTELEGRGIASALVGAVFRELERRRVKIVPVCPYIVAYLQRHPEWERLVAEGGDLRGFSELPVAE